tara:strand:+ start:476 stop:844 length:369 start_codon:yes stop_codon:yes gene_type:complete
LSNNSNIILGKEGEAAALGFLVDKGYHLLHKNWRHNKSEIDLVVKKENKVVFVEVKTRKNNLHSITDLVSLPQQKRILNAANTYIKKYCLDEEIRFDLIEVEIPNKSPNFIHQKEFIQPTLL